MDERPIKNSKEEMSASSWNMPHIVATLIGVIVGGLITIIGNILVMNKQLEHDYEMKEQQYLFERRDKYMTIREEVYHDYLDAANEYFVETFNARECLKDLQERNVANCEMSKIATARYNYMGQLNELRIYGSSEATELAHLMTDELPAPSGRESNTFDGVPADILDMSIEFNDDEFSNLYAEFINLMCRELAVDSSENCYSPN